MWSPHQTPPPIEKIRKAQWSVENTARTQAVVDRLRQARAALDVAGLAQSAVATSITAAITRFVELDPKVEV